MPIKFTPDPGGAGQRPRAGQDRGAGVSQRGRGQADGAGQRTRRASRRRHNLPGWFRGQKVFPHLLASFAYLVVYYYKGIAMSTFWGYTMSILLKGDSMAVISKRGYLCDRCNHEWVPRAATTEAPKVCPKCKSPYWNTPRRSSVHVGRKESTWGAGSRRKYE